MSPSEHFNTTSSDSQSSTTVSDNESSDQPDSSQDSDDKRASEKVPFQPSANVAVDIVPASGLRGFVLFGVSGSRRLQSARLRLAQIDVEEFKDDDAFFEEMVIQYKKLRGYFRWILSIWQFHTCELVMVSTISMSHCSWSED